MDTSYNQSNLWHSDYIRLYMSRAYAAVSTIANTVAWIEKTLTKTNNSEVEIQHPHFQLLTFNMLRSIVSYLQLNGSCYLYKEMIGNRIDSLKILRPDLIELVENADWSFKEYHYNAGGKIYKFQPNEVISFDLFTPYEWFPYKRKWVSPMQAVAIEMETDNVSNIWNWNSFKNGTSAWIVIKSEAQIDKDTKEIMARQWKQKHQWPNNNYNVAIMDNWMELENFRINKQELDFVESMKFTRDKVLEIFKVPRMMLWNTESASLASSKVAFDSYYQICIQPICALIEDVVNRELFKWIGNFRFVNYLPKDTDRLQKDLEIWAITINEYRKERWYAPLKWGDILKDNTPVEVAKPKGQYDDMIKSVVKKYIKGTPEYETEKENKAHANREKKIARIQTYEVKMENVVKSVFEMQEKDILDAVQKKSKSLLSNIKYTTVWKTFVQPILNDLIYAEGNQALWQVWSSQLFKIGNPRVNKFITDTVVLMASEVDKVTKEKVTDILKQGNDAWLWTNEIARMISKQFEEFKSSRSKTIAQTEISNASTFAQLEWRKQSGVVEKKEWFTARDERVCPQCWPMNGKIIWLDDNYFEKWDTYNWLKLDYRPINWPTLHPRCRCDLLPVL